MNELYYGDNVEILRRDIASDSVDLIYLDPPFNSNRSYNVLFRSKSGEESQAQIEAFDDSWSWSQESETQYEELLAHGGRVADAVEAMRKLLGDGTSGNDVLAYLVMMTARLVELHRVLKPTGSIYLHCDPTASHYLKVIMDAIFGAAAFRNEIIWKRTSGHSDATRYGRTHDVILYYVAGETRTWNQQYEPYEDSYVERYYRYSDADGRRFMSDNLSAAGLSGGGYEYEWKGVTRTWRCPIKTMQRLDDEGRIFYTKTGFPRRKRYLDEAKGMPTQDVWTDVEAVRSWHTETLNYPTQKPLALLERIVTHSSNEDDVVLDPFCGCGTAIDAAQRLGRRWIGIDLTYLAIDLIENRLRGVYGEKVKELYTVHGVPRAMPGARALFKQNPFDFERWAVSLVDGTPNQKQVGDKGIDGIVRFPIDRGKIGRSIVSIKGGKQLNPAMVRDLIGTVKSQRAEMGVLITLNEPTKGMKDAARKSGSYDHAMTSRTFPKVQIITIKQLLNGKGLDMPQSLLPYVQARAKKGKQLKLAGTS